MLATLACTAVLFLPNTICAHASAAASIFDQIEIGTRVISREQRWVTLGER